MLRVIKLYGAHHLIVFVRKDMTMVHKPRELNEFLFRDLEIWVKGDCRIVICRSPPDSKDEDCELGHKSCVLPSHLMLLNVACCILANILILSIKAAARNWERSIAILGSHWIEPWIDPISISIPYIFELVVTLSLVDGMKLLLSHFNHEITDFQVSLPRKLGQSWESEVVYHIKTTLLIIIALNLLEAVRFDSLKVDEVEVHGVAFNMHIDDVPILYWAYLWVLRGASLEHMMCSNDECRFLIPVYRPMPLYLRQERLQVIEINIQKWEWLSQRIYLRNSSSAHCKLHFYVDFTLIVKIITNNINGMDITWQGFVKSKEEVDSFSRSEIEMFLVVNRLMHERGIYANYREG